MKRLLLAAATLLMLPSCGLYTNVPAQIHVLDVKPASLSYGKADTDGYREVKIEQASATLTGEPGSIGATFEEMTVDYIKPNSPSFVDSSDILPLKLRSTVRVDSSNFVADPGPNNLDHAQTGTITHVAKAVVNLPVVTRHVQDYGAKTAINSPAITAQVKLSGFDDAGFPISVVVYVPITFTGSPGAATPK